MHVFAVIRCSRFSFAVSLEFGKGGFVVATSPRLSTVEWELSMDRLMGDTNNQEIMIAAED